MADFFRDQPRLRLAIGGTIVLFVWILFVASLLFMAPTVMAAADKVIDATAAAGVVGDGATLNTARIQKAIDDCAAAGGGMVRFAAGRYLTGTIQIRRNSRRRLTRALGISSPVIVCSRSASSRSSARRVSSAPPRR